MISRQYHKFSLLMSSDHFRLVIAQISKGDDALGQVIRNLHNQQINISHK